MMRGRWVELWQRSGAGTAPDPHPLLRRWAEPRRCYHGLSHLRHCLAVYDRNPLRDDRVELALWFHDTVYDAQARDNEERSADLFAAAAAAAGLGSETIAVVRSCILATRHRAEPATAAERLTLDVDLAILGESRRRFARYDAAIRREYAWVADDVYARERRRVLMGFLERPRLYRTPWFQRRFADAARRNLLRATG